MTNLIQHEAPPIREDETGTLRVGASQVLIDLVIGDFLDGAAPETIAENYPTATLADVYGVIAYYMRHRAELDAYIDDRERQGEELKTRIEAARSEKSIALIERILAARKARESE